MTLKIMTFSITINKAWHSAEYYVMFMLNVMLNDTNNPFIAEWRGCQSRTLEVTAWLWFKFRNQLETVLVGAVRGSVNHFTLDHDIRLCRQSYKLSPTLQTNKLARSSLFKPLQAQSSLCLKVWELRSQVELHKVL